MFLKETSIKSPALAIIEQLVGIGGGQSLIASDPAAIEALNQAMSIMAAALRPSFLKERLDDGSVLVTRLQTVIRVDTDRDLLSSRILKILKTDGGASFGKLKQYLKPRKAEEVRAALSELIANGSVSESSEIHKFNKRPYQYYTLRGAQ